MSTEDVRGLSLNPKTASYMLSLIALFGFVWQVNSYAKGFEQADAAIVIRQDTIDKWIAAREKSDEKLIARLEAQAQDISEIKIMLAELKIQLAKPK